MFKTFFFTYNGKKPFYSFTTDFLTNLIISKNLSHYWIFLLGTINENRFKLLTVRNLKIYFFYDQSYKKATHLKQEEFCPNYKEFLNSNDFKTSYKKKL